MAAIAYVPVLVGGILRIFINRYLLRGPTNLHHLDLLGLAILYGFVLLHLVCQSCLHLHLSKMGFPLQNKLFELVILSEVVRDHPSKHYAVGDNPGLKSLLALALS